MNNANVLLIPLANFQSHVAQVSKWLNLSGFIHFKNRLMALKMRLYVNLPAQVIVEKRFFFVNQLKSEKRVEKWKLKKTFQIL